LRRRKLQSLQQEKGREMGKKVIIELENPKSAKTSVPKNPLLKLLLAIKVVKQTRARIYSREGADPECCHFLFGSRPRFFYALIGAMIPPKSA